MDQMNAPSDCWGECPVPLDFPAVRDFGSLRLWFRALHGDLWLAHRRRAADGEEKENPPDNPIPLKVSSGHGGPSKEPLRNYGFLPFPPDLAVVVRLEAPFVLSPGATAGIYVRCPLWVREFLGEHPLRRVDGEGEFPGPEERAHRGNQEAFR